MKLIQGSIVAAKGYQAAGEFVGIKRHKKDMSMIYSEVPAVYAGAFTQNIVRAAPVLWDEALLKKGEPVQAIIVNSGNANAVTGPKGYEDTVSMARKSARVLGLKEEQVIVCSTGVIGVNLPMNIIEAGIEYVATKLGDSLEHAENAAKGILTTDNFPKEIAIAEKIEGYEVKLGAIGKGSGMIHPNMATMLAFVTTDVNITQTMLQKALKQCIDLTFNMITVDGDTSTNDSVIVLANGRAENPIIDIENEAFEKFCEMLYEALKYIAISIVKDGEGATKLLEVTIEGAESFVKGKQIAKAILTSSLVKTAFFGEDANWGRILAAMGASGIEFNPKTVTLSLGSNSGDICLFKEGMPLKFSEVKAKTILQESEIAIKIAMKEGTQTVTAWGCDLSYEYVKINGEYRS